MNLFLSQLEEHTSFGNKFVNLDLETLEKLLKKKISFKTLIIEAFKNDENIEH